MAKTACRKLVLGLAAATLLSGATARAADVNAAFVKGELYIWNRIADLTELFRCGLGVGPAFGAEIAFTQYAQLGAYTADETGASFPHFFPPAWVITYLDDEKVFKTHRGDYKTRSFGPRRWENTVQQTVRFRREPWDVRAQLGLGLFQVYLNFDTKQTGDFLAGFVCKDPREDDQQANPNAIREPTRQFGRGASNIITAVLEIPYNMHQVNEDKGGFAGVTAGFARGLWRCGVRAVVGAVEVATFPMGWPPIIEPEYMYQPARSTAWRVREPTFRKEF